MMTTTFKSKSKSHCDWQSVSQSVCSRNSLGDSTCSLWSVSFISWWMVAYRCSMPVNRALPSRCLQSTVLSASALVVRSLHTMRFPFSLGDMCTRHPIVIRQSGLNLFLPCSRGVMQFGHHFISQMTLIFGPTMFQTQLAPPSHLLDNTSENHPTRRPVGLTTAAPTALLFQLSKVFQLIIIHKP
jgi:hypothetical protein